ncbi:hypothetical protein C8J56DRAFT_69182 [Mycena floridula]|nr:hypothetical protein C8J56DRAFT_69182 [Mycena floridula]
MADDPFWHIRILSASLYCDFYRHWFPTFPRLSSIGKTPRYALPINIIGTLPSNEVDVIEENLLALHMKDLVSAYSKTASAGRSCSGSYIETSALLTPLSVAQLPQESKPVKWNRCAMRLQGRDFRKPDAMGAGTMTEDLEKRKKVLWFQHHPKGQPAIAIPERHRRELDKGIQPWLFIMNLLSATALFVPATVEPSPDTGSGITEEKRLGETEESSQKEGGWIRS